VKDGKRGLGSGTGAPYTKGDTLQTTVEEMQGYGTKTPVGETKNSRCNEDSRATNEGDGDLEGRDSSR